MAHDLTEKLADNLAIRIFRLALIAAVLAIAGCGNEPPVAQTDREEQVTPQDPARASEPSDTPAAAPTLDDARQFVVRVQREKKDFGVYSSRIYWLQETHITFDTTWLRKRVSAEETRRAVAYANEAKRFQELDLSADPDLARTMRLITLSTQFHKY